MSFNYNKLTTIAWVAACTTSGPVFSESAANSAAPVASPSADESTLAEITVTAQKRSQSLQDTPLSVSALDGAGLREANIVDIKDINNTTPNITVGDAFGATRLSIRGVGLDTLIPGQEGRIAYNLDGIYVSRPESAADTFFDVERIEVVRGPQGTLYGRNATGGAFNVITRGPTDQLAGYGEVTIGNFGLIQTEGAIGGPIADRISGRVAFTTVQHSGYGHDGLGNDINSLKTRGVRAKLKFDITDDFNLTLAGDYFRQNDASGTLTFVRPISSAPLPAVYAAANFVLPSNPYQNTDGDGQTNTHRSDYGASATASYDLSRHLNITSITAYRTTDFRTAVDQDNTLLPYATYMPSITSQTLSEELRASGKVDQLTYVGGLYYLHDAADPRALDVYDRALFGLPSLMVPGYDAGAHLLAQSAAVFGQVGYDFTDQWGIDVGARYSWEKDEKFHEYFSFNLTDPYVPGAPPVLLAGFAQNPIPYASRTDTSFDPKVTLRFQATPDVLTYLTFSQGFKSGGFNVGALQPSFAPEKLRDYEAGVKADWLDHRLRTNVAAFYYDYKNLQVSKIINTTQEIENAAAAKLYGAEFEITALITDSLQVNVGAGVEHSYYKDFSSIDPTGDPTLPVDLDGNQLVNAPNYNVNVGIQYTFHSVLGSLIPRADASWVDRTYFTAFNRQPVSQAPYERFNAYLNYESSSGRLYGGLFVKNIADRNTLAAAETNIGALGDSVEGIPMAPRTFGAKIGYRF